MAGIRRGAVGPPPCPDSRSTSDCNTTLGDPFTGDTAGFALIPGVLYAYKSIGADLASYIAPAAIPSPASAGLLLAGLALLGNRPYDMAQIPRLSGKNTNALTCHVLQEARRIRYLD
jgi:hypothetical protein